MRLALTLAIFALASPAVAQEAGKPVTPTSIVAAASAEEWIEIPQDDLLIMELAPTADGSERTVIIQLMPPPFSQPWVENIKTLARARWWDGKSIYRSVDNWVVQWGGGDPDLGFPEPDVPEGVVAPVVDYTTPAELLDEPVLISEFERDNTLHQSDELLDENGRLWRSYFDVVRVDNFAQMTLHYRGWPIASTLSNDPTDPTAVSWPIHCYGSIGVARDLAPDTGTGSELYAVIGHAPRQLDRNIAVVGRVIAGMAHLSTLPRGTGDYGVYESRDEDTPIASVRLASEHPEGAQYRYEYLDTASESFAKYVHSRANRQDDFYAVPAGGVDICNVQVPVRLIE